jgi:REP element-mobilizing transposase RayT
MRSARVKADGQAYYHCVSRVVDRRMILGDLEREKFRELMRGAETFCGVRVLTYAILSNHFHILAEVPDRQDVNEAEIVARLPAIYDRRAIHEMQSQWALWRQQGLEHLVQGDLSRLRARMYDVSAFVKTVKQRFTQWYNRREGRCGTLWEDRFKSVMVEPPAHTTRARQDVGALATLAAYIDLNAVRAGIVKDPKDYCWCGYGEAVAGRERAREGLTAVLGGEAGKSGKTWRAVAANYRLLIYAAGEEQGVAEHAGMAEKAGISPETVAKVVRERGELPLQQVLRCRVRYFSDGVAIGSRTFVNEVFRLHRGNFGPKRQHGARPMRFAAWGGLCAARDLRLAPIAASGG